MNNVFDINKIKQEREENKKQYELDLIASYTALETCLKIININNLTELKIIKFEITKTLKELSRLNGR